MAPLSPEEVRVVRSARDLIADRTRWTTHAFARDVDGVSVNPAGERAVQWCGTGALVRYECARFLGAWNAVKGRLGGSVSAVNDGPEGYERVCAAMDAVLAEADGS